MASGLSSDGVARSGGGRVRGGQPTRAVDLKLFAGEVHAEGTVTG